GGVVIGRAVTCDVVGAVEAAKLVAVTGTGVIAGGFVAGFGVFEGHRRTAGAPGSVSGEGFGQAAAAAAVGWVLAAVGVFVELFVRRGGAQVPATDAVEEEVDDRRSEEGEHLGDEQAADDGDAERGAEL